MENNFCKNVNKNSLKTAIISTFVFSMLANAFAYFNFYPQHDSIYHTFHFAGNWEVSLGRFLLPFYGKIFGDVTLPWIEGILSICFISLSVYSISEILKFTDTWQIVLISGFLSANLCITERAGTFTYVLGAYMLSMFLSCQGVYLLIEYQSMWAKLLAVLCFVCSLGIYQGEIAVGIALLVFCLIRDAFQDQKFSEIIKKWIPIGVVLICSSLIYYILYKLALAVYGIEAANSYNSLSNLANVSLKSLVSVTIGCYKAFVNFFFGSECIIGTVIARSCNIIFGVLTLGILLRHFLVHKMQWYNKAIIILVIMAFPGIACMMNIMMLKGKLSFYVLYALFLYYVLCLLIIKECSDDFKKLYWAGIVKRVLILCFAAIMFQNVTFSNETYIYQKVMYDRAVSVAGNILNSIETCTEYEAGETEVILIGELQKNDGFSRFSEKADLTGGEVLSITYNQTFGSFAKLLGYKFNRLSDTVVVEQYKNCQEVLEMPAYPKEGYWQMIDGKLVIKLSE